MQMESLVLLSASGIGCVVLRWSKSLSMMWSTNGGANNGSNYSRCGLTPIVWSIGQYFISVFQSQILLLFVLISID